MSPPAHGVDQGQQLVPGMGWAGPLAQVNQVVGGLLDAQPLGQGGRQEQAGVGDGLVSSKRVSSWSMVWGIPIENLAS